MTAQDLSVRVCGLTCEPSELLSPVQRQIEYRQTHSLAVDGVKMRPPPDSTFRTFAQKTGGSALWTWSHAKDVSGDGRGILLGYLNWTKAVKAGTRCF